jgi:hypothetical protein
VEFIVVGGAAAVLHGAPITTQDLDIVHRRTPENVQRLLSALQALDARFRDPAGRLLRPQPEHLLGSGGYDELIDRTASMTDGATTLQILDLPTLIEVKTAAGRARDRIAVPLLLALLDRTDQER